MGWVRIDDRMPRHPKILRLRDPGSRWDFVALLCWCAENRNDGRFHTRDLLDLWVSEHREGDDLEDENGAPDASGDEVDEDGFARLRHGSRTASARVSHGFRTGSSRAIRERYRRRLMRLVRAGLVDDLGSGVLQVHDYLDYQISREADERRREGQRERQRRYEAAQAERAEQGRAKRAARTRKAATPDASGSGPDASSRARRPDPTPPYRGGGGSESARMNADPEPDPSGTGSAAGEGMKGRPTRAQALAAQGARLAAARTGDLQRVSIAGVPSTTTEGGT